MNADGSVLDDLQGYRIFRKKTAGATFALVGSVGASATTYTDSGMKDGASYIYAVAAFDDEALPQEGEKSAELEVKQFLLFQLASLLQHLMVRFELTGNQLK